MGHVDAWAAFALAVLWHPARAWGCRRWGSRLPPAKVGAGVLTVTH